MFITSYHIRKHHSFCNSNLFFNNLIEILLQYTRILDTDTKEMFSNVWIALGILLTIPVTVASGVGSFSKLNTVQPQYYPSVSGLQP